VSGLEQGNNQNRHREQLVQRFVLACMQQMGATVEELPDGSHRLISSGESGTGLEPGCVFTFDRGITANRSRIECITDGHPLLDQLIACASQQGSCVNLILPLDTGSTNAPEQEVSRPSRVVQGNREARLLSTRLVYHPYVLFRFRVAFTADVKSEVTYSLVVNPVNGDVSRVQDIAQACGLQLDAAACRQRGRHLVDAGIAASWDSRATGLRDHLKYEQGLELRRSSYTLYQMYGKAATILSEIMNPDLERFKAAVRKQLDDDISRLDSYYRDLGAEVYQPLGELLRKAAVAQVRADLAKSLETKQLYQSRLAQLKDELRTAQAEYRDRLRHLRQERERRIQDIGQRYRVRVTVKLTGVANVYTPHWEMDCCLTGRRMETFVVNALSRELVAPVCDRCQMPAARLTVCDEDLVCDGCLACPEDGDSPR